MSTDASDRSQVELQALLEKLEALVTTGTRVPLTSLALVDEQEFVDLLDQMRNSIPEEVRQAKRVSKEREVVIQQAQVEADKILSAANEQARTLLDENELVRSAGMHAERIYNDAMTDAEAVKRGADEYALAALDDLEQHLTRLMTTIRKGKSSLERTLRTTTVADNGMPDQDFQNDDQRNR